VSRVCFTLRYIFQSYSDLDVRINCDENLWCLKRTLAAPDAYPSLLARISSIALFTEVLPLDGLWLTTSKAQPLSFWTKYIISAFLRNAPCMPRLHTAIFSRIIVDKEHLELLFHSRSLHTLVLGFCGFRGMAPRTPSHIRHLEMRYMEDMNPFLGHCSPNLETLLLTCPWQMPGSTRLPLFPKLRKLVFGRPMNQLNTLISLAPQLEYLELLGSGERHHWRLVIPASVNYLTIEGMPNFGTGPFLHFHHLHLKHVSHRSITPFIQLVFPNLTSLELDISGSFRNFTLLLARALPNVTRLKLDIWGTYPRDDCDTSDIVETPVGRLSSLYVNVSNTSRGKDYTKSYEDWILHTVFPPTVGLGGPHLREVDVVFSRGSNSIPSVWWYWKRVEKEWFFEKY